MEKVKISLVIRKNTYLYVLKKKAISKQSQEYFFTGNLPETN